MNTFVKICNFNKLENYIQEQKITGVINCAAYTDVDKAEENQKQANLINHTAVKELATIAKTKNIKLIHISTDFIFVGEEGPYSETDEPNPLSYYGLSKLKSEQLLYDSTINWTILRTIILYGTAENLQRNNIVLWGRKALKEGKPLNIIDDQFRSPTLAEDLAKACVLAIEKQATGIFNASGKDFMSIFEMIERMADFYNCDKSNINRISSETLNQKAKRPPKTGFMLTKSNEELGYEPHSFEEGLKLLEQQLN